MLASRNFSVFVALVSMVTFSMVGCCGGNCGGLPFGKNHVSQGASSQSCSTCGSGASYSAPTQSFAMPSQSYSTPSQGYSTEGFSSHLPSSVQGVTGDFPTSIPSIGGSGSR